MVLKLLQIILQNNVLLLIMTYNKINFIKNLMVLYLNKFKNLLHIYKIKNTNLKKIKQIYHQNKKKNSVNNVIIMVN